MIFVVTPIFSNEKVSCVLSVNVLLKTTLLLISVSTYVVSVLQRCGYLLHSLDNRCCGVQEIMHKAIKDTIMSDLCFISVCFVVVVFCASVVK